MTKTTMWVTDVPVATIWTNRDSPRDMDQIGIENPIHLDKWYSDLTYERRKEMIDDKLVQSQLLYGEEVLVEEVDGDWAKIIAVKQPSNKDERGYPGWVPLNQLKEVEKSDWIKESIALVTAKQAYLYNENEQPVLNLSFLTYLPVIEETNTFVKVQTPAGSRFLKKEDVSFHPSIDEVSKKDGNTVIKLAEQFLDLPYFWGGMSAFGYDCSGFSYNLHKAAGYNIPRDASDQSKEGLDVPFDELQPGDLLFFANENGFVHHVGLYHSDGKMIHSAFSRKGIEITPIKGTIYEKQFSGARRYLL